MESKYPKHTLLKLENKIADPSMHTRTVRVTLTAGSSIEYFRYIYWRNPLLQAVVLFLAEISIRSPRKLFISLSMLKHFLDQSTQKIFNLFLKTEALVTGLVLAFMCKTDADMTIRESKDTYHDTSQ